MPKWVIVPQLAVAVGNVIVALVAADPLDAAAKVAAWRAYAVPDVETSLAVVFASLNDAVARAT